ncbi:LamG-like jellyroll fold domain-containing protein [Serratia quinivorans]|uniref:LamG-like jellyroll fold domain-containing protein n=1 Tax=Serratia quinivorans TaxID=137545 RepID=UPI003F9B573E
MAGTRIFCNAIIPTADWNNDYVPVKGKLITRAPLPVLASFDLLNPLDNSGNGYEVSAGGAKVQPWGLHYDNGAAPSQTNFVKTGHGAVSFVTAFRLNAVNRYINIFSNRSTGNGFNLYYSGQLLMGYIFPSGTTGNIAVGTVAQPVVGEWYVAAGVFDPVNKKANVQFSELGLRYGDIGASFPVDTTLNTPMSIGGDPNGSTTSSMNGDIAFSAVYDGVFTVDQRDSMMSVGMEVLTDRGLI